MRAVAAGLGISWLIQATLHAPVSRPDGRVKAAPADPVVVGQTSTLSLTILDPVSEATPLWILVRGEGVGLPENRLGWDHVVDPQAERPRVSFRVSAPMRPGDYFVEAEVHYLGCERRVCVPRTSTVGWWVPVTEPEL